MGDRGLTGADIVADGRSGANRNDWKRLQPWPGIVADGRSGANRNRRCMAYTIDPIIADGRSGANRNTALPRK